MDAARRVINFTLAVVFLILGAAAMAWLIQTKPQAPRHVGAGRVLEVLVTPVEAQREETPVVAHGTVGPKNQVDIIPQVSGKLIDAHEDLAVGKLIAEGELLFEIDPTLYQSRVRQAEGEARRLRATVSRHDQELANLNVRIANIQEILAIGEKDYLTQKRLFDVDAVGTQRDVDELHLRYLQQKDVLVDLTSRRSLIPLLKLDTKAQLDIAESRLQQARYDLENTRILCPFRARVERVDAYASEVVTAHFAIARLTDMGAFEISIGVDPRELRWLDETIHPSSLGQSEQAAGPPVCVRWSLHGQEYRWRGYVTRFERVDEVTRTARMVVEVRAEDMTATVAAGSEGLRPELSIGMYCRAELPAEPLVDALLVPRHAVYDNRWVYVFEPHPCAEDPRAGRLGRRRIAVLRSVADHVLVDYAGRSGTEVCELAAGDQVVVSPLAKPVPGMRIRLRDTQLAWEAYPPAIIPRLHQPVLTRAPATLLAQIAPTRGGG